MPSLTLPLGARVIATCDPSLDFEARSVLQLFEEFESTGSPILDGRSIPFGWSQLSVHARGDDLILCEPRFDGDPFVEVSDDITQTLSVLVDQAALVQRLGVASQPTAFHDEIVVACGALDQPRIYCERSESGWYIGRSDADAEGEVECETLRVYQLLQRRPALLAVMALPVGTLVAFTGDSIEAVLDERDTDLWHPS
ncbi:MAG: hypothetical protein ABI867_39360 [Kofleriaceae bacterium]